MSEYDVRVVAGVDTSYTGIHERLDDRELQFDLAWIEIGQGASGDVAELGVQVVDALPGGLGQRGPGQGTAPSVSAAGGLLHIGADIGGDAVKRGVRSSHCGLHGVNPRRKFAGHHQLDQVGFGSC